MRTSRKDFAVVKRGDAPDDPLLQVKHAGWLWSRETVGDGVSGGGDIRVALFGDATQYFPERDDYVVASVAGKTSEYYFCEVGSGASFVLGALDFEGATKKNRPLLAVGDTVYARITETGGFLRGRLSCVNPRS